LIAAVVVVIIIVVVIVVLVIVCRGCLLSLLVHGMVLVEVGIELTTTTRLVSKEPNRIAHVWHDSSFKSVLVVLSTRPFTKVQEIDHHGLGKGVIAVTAKFARWVRTDIRYRGDVLRWQSSTASLTRRWCTTGRTSATAAPLRPLLLFGRAL